jgi:hypothetical protein
MVPNLLVRAPQSAEPDELTSERRSSRPLDIAFGVVVFAIGFGFYSARWINLFPLDEFRSWLWLPRGSVGDLARHVALVRDQQYATYASRGVSMFLVKASANACDLNTPCLNAVQLVAIAGAAVLLYTLVLRLVHRRAIAAVAGLLWVFSVPVLDSVSWQATINDKLAALFTLMGLNIGLAFFRKAPTFRTVVFGNAALLAVVVLAYNSKESAWVLVPSLALLAAATLQRFDWRALRSRCAYLVLPALYAAYHFVLYTRHTQSDDVWSGHIRDGDPWENLKAYVRILANGESVPDHRAVSRIATVAVIVAVIAITISATVVLARRGWNASSVPARLALWGFGSMVIAFAVPIRTQFHDSYYMVVPAIFLYVVLAAGAAMVADTHAVPQARLAAGGLTAAVVIVLALNYHASYDHTYARIPDQSSNFTEAIRQVGHVLPRDSQQPTVLVSSDTATNAYHFLGGGTWRDLYEYIFDVDHRDPAFEQHFVDMKRSTFDTTPRDANTYYVIFDAAMRLERIYRGTTVLSP